MENVTTQNVNVMQGGLENTAQRKLVPKIAIIMVSAMLC
jgi:hypothetical protein